MPNKPDLPVNPELVAAVAKKRGRPRGRTADVLCDKPDCDYVGRSKAELAEHLIEVHPTGVFGPEKQDEYLAEILAGTGKHTAARRIKLAPSTVERFISLNPAFERAVKMAEEEYTEQVEAKLYEAALNAEPWAVKEVLSKRNSRRWGTIPQEINVNQRVEVTATHELSPQMARVAEIMSNLNARRALSGANDIIDAEIIEEA